MIRWLGIHLSKKVWLGTWGTGMTRAFRNVYIGKYRLLLLVIILLRRKNIDEDVV